MVRSQKDRMVGYNPQISYFKPCGIPLLQLKEVRLTVDEREAIRLSDLLGMSHEEAGQYMGVSRATFGRIIQRARQLVADALIIGKAIQVGGAIIAWLSRIEFFDAGTVAMSEKRPLERTAPVIARPAGRMIFIVC